jgi:hypothetical protein
MSTPPVPVLPATIDHDRVIVSGMVSAGDGRTVPVRVWIDTGNPQLWVSGRLAVQLGLTPRSPPKAGWLGTGQRVAAPSALLLGGLRLDLAGAGDALSFTELDTAGPGNPADINLPSAVLRHFAVVIDYRGRTVTLGPPGTLALPGSCTTAAVDATDGTVDVPASIAGEQRRVTVDIGASCSLIDPAVVGRAAAQRPAASLVGAVGPANMWGTDDEASWQLAIVPEVHVGGANLGDVVVAAFGSQADFEGYTAHSRAPSFGLIGGASLRGARLGIDYANSRVCVEAEPDAAREHVDSVGLVLRPEPDGRFTVLTVPRVRGDPAVPTIKAGASLLAVDEHATAGHSLGEVLAMLSGHEGDVHRLRFDQGGGRTFQVDARVYRLI